MNKGIVLIHEVCLCVNKFIRFLLGLIAGCIEKEILVKNKIIIVTGGAGIIGRSFVCEIAMQGATVVVADIDINSAKSLVEQIKGQVSGRVEAAQLDITSLESIKALITDVSLRHGYIDAVINNAYPCNINYGRKLEEVTYSDFCENVSMHLGGYYLVAQQFCMYFREQGGGNLINMSSIYGTIAPRFELYEGTSMTMPVEYAAIKSAIVHLTHYFAQYFKSYGIRVNCLSPGGIINNQPESFMIRYAKYCGTKGMLEANDLVGTLIYLLSDSSRYVTGQNIIIDDGFTL